MDQNEKLLTPREEVISTAVKFLQNPKVQQGAIAQKEQFLRKKGLSDDEIRISFERAGPYKPLPESFRNADNSHTTVVPLDQNIFKKPPPSRLERFRELLNTVAIISGISYAVYLFYKKFIEPYLFGRKKRKSIEESVEELNKTVTKNVAELRSNLTEVKVEVEKLHHFETSTASRQLEELKNEISTLKSLLLNRKQFPTVSQVVPPSIPAWQLTSSSHQGLQECDEGEHGEAEGEMTKHDELDYGSGSGSSETEVVTKNSDSSLEIMSV